MGESPGAGCDTGAGVVGTVTGPVGPTGTAGGFGSPGTVTLIPSPFGTVTVTPIGSPPVPVDNEPPTGSLIGASGPGSVVGTVTVSADAGALSVASDATTAAIPSTPSRRAYPIGTTSRV